MTPGLSNSMFDLKFVVKLVMLTMEEWQGGANSKGREGNGTTQKVGGYLRDFNMIKQRGKNSPWPSIGRHAIWSLKEGMRECH